MNNHNATYNITLPPFEGPFDLLLFFIERDELDINDIPISTITNDFLDYLHQMERMNIDLASEFILVAATLCRIKAKMLIPRKPVDEEGNEIDPREELVNRLMEYKRYKSVLDEMRTLEEARSLRTPRGNVSDELKSIATLALVDSELESLTLFKLLRAFERVMSRMEDNKPVAVHQIVQFSYNIEDQAARILMHVQGGQRATFQLVFAECKNRIHAIVTFLALLDLLNASLLKMTVGEGMNNFWLEEPDPETPDVEEHEEEEAQAVPEEITEAGGSAEEDDEEAPDMSPAW